MFTILYIKGTSVSNKRSNPETAFKKAICMTAHIINRYGTIFREEGATKKYVSKYPDYKDYDSLNLEKIPAVFQNEDITVMNDRYGHFWQMIWRSCDANDPKRRPVIIEACFSINKNNTINIMIRQSLPTFDVTAQTKQNPDEYTNVIYDAVHKIMISDYVEDLSLDEDIGIDTGNGISYIQNVDGRNIPPKCIRQNQRRNRLNFQSSNHMPLLIVESNEQMLRLFMDSTTILCGCAALAPCLVSDPSMPLFVFLYIAGKKHEFYFDRPTMDIVTLVRSIVSLCVMNADQRYRRDNPLMKPMLSPTVEAVFSGKITARYEQKIVNLTNKLGTMETMLDAANKKLRAANASSQKESQSKNQINASAQYAENSELREAKNALKAMTADLIAKDTIIAQQQEDYTALKKQSKEQERRQQALIEHLKNKLSRPNKFSKIADWTRENFAGHLELTTKAERMLNVSDLSIDIDILCDAIEYLSTEYLDYMKNEITQNEMTSLMGLKYNRPFTVVPVMDSIITSAPEAYTTAYMTANNTLETRELNLHLRYGVNPETLIRIYFFYDDKEKKIVVGSLPKHL